MEPMVITPEILEAVRGGLQTTFQDVFDGVETMWPKLATEVPSTTGGNNYDWLSDIPGIREWIGDRQIRRLSEQGYRIENKLFEGTIGVKRTHVEDGNMGSYNVRTSQLADRAAKHPDKLIFQLIPNGFTTRCFDGQNFFDTEHPVGPDGKQVSVSNMQAGDGPTWYLLDTSAPLKPFIWQKRTNVEFTSVDAEGNASAEIVFMKDEYLFGTRHRGNAGFGMWQLAFASKAPLTNENVAAAREAMEGYLDNEGEELGVSPDVLLVGRSNRVAGTKIVDAKEVPVVQSDGSIVKEHNPLMGAFTLMVAPRLK